jgi:hypothetical protein
MIGSPPRETRIAVLLCVLAALRVFVLSAAFPFFNNVDEQSHFDLVYKYSRGHVPGSLEHRDPEAARAIVLYSSPEYLYKSGQYPKKAPPRYRWPQSVEAQNDLERMFAESEGRPNFESTQPPLYYAVAGAWYRIGKWIGLRGGQALYWTRFLNVAAYACLTWLAYVFATTCFPKRPFLRLGVPFLVAFFPQDIFFGVNNDVLLPLVGGAAFLCLVLIHRGQAKRIAFYAGTGLLVAASILVKFSSVALLPVSAAIVVLSVLRPRHGEEKSSPILKGAVLLACAAVPIGAWCLRNVLLLGDVTGSTGKTDYLTWTLKPLTAMFDHPIFTPSGMGIFWQETLMRFWRGEFAWELQSMASPGWDRFYGLSSLVFLAAAVIAPATWRKDTPDVQREVLWPSLALFLLSLAFLAAISVMYDFGTCYYPSRAMPYVTSGRLALGALIPFLALYLYGLDALLPARLPVWARWTVLIVPVVWMTVSEFLMAGAAFRSAYNWFHMI